MKKFSTQMKIRDYFTVMLKVEAKLECHKFPFFDTFQGYFKIRSLNLTLRMIKVLLSRLKEFVFEVM